MLHLCICAAGTGIAIVPTHEKGTPSLFETKNNQYERRRATKIAR